MSKVNYKGREVVTYIAKEDKRFLRLSVYAARPYERHFYHTDVSYDNGKRNIDWDQGLHRFVQ